MGKITQIILFLLLATLFSCGGNEVVFRETKTFDNPGWNRFKELTFTPEIQDISKTYLIKLHLELTDNYPFEYMQVQFTKSSADGESYYKIFSIPVKGLDGKFLVDTEDGVHNVTGILTNQFFFNKAGTYTITIKQLMPKFNTPGVKSVELIIEKRDK